MQPRMNRIRQLREARGLSAEQLAVLIGTSAVQVRRLETGARKLTEDWMRRIAVALGVEPADLLETASIAGLHNEVEPAEPRGLTNVARALAGRKMRFYKVLSGAVADSGLVPGRVFLADESSDAVATTKTGDIVVVEMCNLVSAKPELYLGVRVFVAPDLFTTNRPGTNLAIKIGDPSVGIRIIGVMVPDSIEDGH